MKLTYTIAHRLPKGHKTYTPQGLRDIYTAATSNKRSTEYKIEIEAKRTRDYSNFDQQVESSLLEALDSYLCMATTEWTVQHSALISQIHSLFLYERDNAPLWTKIESVFHRWISAFTEETRSLELSDLLRSVVAVRLNCHEMFLALENFLYWFNATVEKLHGRTVSARLLKLLNDEFLCDAVIVSRVQQAVVELHKLASIAGNAESLEVQAFGAYFLPIYSAYDEQVTDALLEAIAKHSISQIGSTSSLSSWLDSYDLWKAKERLLWQESTQKFELALRIVDKLESSILQLSLGLFESQLISTILSDTDTFERFSVLMQNSRVSSLFNDTCERTIFEYYDTKVLSATSSPMVSAALLCDFAQATLVGTFRSITDFNKHWLAFINAHMDMAKSLAQLAAQDMSRQVYYRVYVIGEILELVVEETSLPLDDELSPFLDTFGSVLWKSIAELSWSQKEGNRVSRYVHGVNILGTRAPGVVWKSLLFLKQLENAASPTVLNHQYWPGKVKYEFSSEETEATGTKYAQEHVHRAIKWDYASSYCQVELNGSRIDCTRPEYEVLKALSEAPGFCLQIDALKFIPRKLVDETLKSLISSQRVIYVPATKAKKFEPEDLIYLTHE